MRHATLILSLLTLSVLTAHAQIPNLHSVTRPLERNKPVEVRFEKNGIGDYEFYSYNNSFSPYILEVYFTELTNLRAISASLPFKEVVPVGTHQIFILRKENPHERTHFNYHIRYREGCLAVTADTSATYLLPVAPGRSTQIYEERNINKLLGDESEPKDWYALGLKMRPGDTVYAARRGVVTRMRDTVSIRDSALYFSRESNFVEIYHNDCTFALYNVLKQNGVFVQPGQIVEAGQPIGLVGGENYLSGTHVSFSVHYNLEQDVLKDGQSTGKKMYWAYVPVQFWTKESGRAMLVNHHQYTSEHPSDLVTREMSKKETEKWKEQHP